MYTLSTTTVGDGFAIKVEIVAFLEDLVQANALSLPNFVEGILLLLPHGDGVTRQKKGS